MAISNRERIGTAIDLLRDGLLPFVSQTLESKYGPRWFEQVKHVFNIYADSPDKIDAQALLRLLQNGWNDIFGVILGKTERNYVFELTNVRNDWAHQEPFSTSDTERALDTISRLLLAVSAHDQAEKVEADRQRLRREEIENQARKAVRKATTASVATQTITGLRPWRAIVSPHRDVQKGTFQNAEFAADLSQVANGRGTAEYADPIEFFRRTYMTNGLQRLLTSAMLRLGGVGGDPVIELQTNFGGGKTHSMLALYHITSDVDLEKLDGFGPILAAAKAAGVDTGAMPHHAVLVGTALSPGQPWKKDDGTVINTMWGELAWQLGRRKGYALIAESDRAGTNPGSELLVQLFEEYSPSLILIDEWVTYIRQLYQQDGKTGGTFDANISFAQSLTEAVRQSRRTMLVASIPSSDIEVGGEGGRAALERLRNTFARMQSPWRPASAEESFEIVRRRLFEPIDSADLMAQRDAVIRAFIKMYTDAGAAFPQRATEAAYRQRLETAYPIHPELFDQLYGAWSTLDTFQRTRGVLRLMAAVISTLWQRQDASLLIMPSSLPLDPGSVFDEITKFLDNPWKPVIERDVDGDRSLPLRLDTQNTNFGRVSATRRVARTIFLGSAPIPNANNRGIEGRDVLLGSAQPGENSSTFGDALRELSAQATHLYSDNGRYWFSTQPSVTRTAIDRAKGFSEQQVFDEVARRLKDQRERGDFVRVHVCPSGSSDVRDEVGAALVILDPEHQHSKGNDHSPARAEALKILESRGESPRLYKNSLTFVAADTIKWRDLESAVREYLAWKSIVDDTSLLNLDDHQKKQSENRMREKDAVVGARLNDAYPWVLLPVQPDAKQAGYEWDELRTQGDGDIAKRVSNRLRNDGALFTTWNGTSLRQYLDRIPLWRGEHVAVKQLVDDFGRYLYLPKLKNEHVLFDAIAQGLNNAVWTTETFALADSFDGEKQRYLGLVYGQHRMPTLNQVLVKPDVALAQIRADEETRTPPVSVADPYHPEASATGLAATSPTIRQVAQPVVEPPKPRRYTAQIQIDPTKLATDAQKIAQEVLNHLVMVPGSKVTVSLEIDARAADSFPDDVRRVVDENSRTLKFTAHEFEES